MKINVFQWSYSPFLLLGFGVFGIQPANAQVICETPSMSPLTFGNVDPQSSQTDAMATFTMKCKNNNRSRTRAATICLSIGEPRQMMGSSSNLLNFQLYQDLSRTNIWGSQFISVSGPALQFNVTLAKNASDTYPVPLYGRVLPGQTDVIPGVYEQSYPGGNNGEKNARVTINAPTDGGVPTTCYTEPTGSLYFPFTVSATVPKVCKVTTTGDLNFGENVLAATTPTTTSSSANLINVTCTNSTPYKIGLSPSNGNVEGMGIMSSSTSADPVYYQLRSTAGIAGKVWGNDNVTSPTSSNRVTRVGTGAVQGETVYATVSNTDVKPGTYSDIVTVHVDY